VIVGAIYSHLFSAADAVAAIDITQTIAIPDLFNPGPSSISILGAAPDGMTTFLYFVPDPEASTTFTGMALPS
jgi:hypothetical protein